METEFDSLNLSKDIVNAICKRGFKKPTEIQERIIPLILEEKNDVIGISHTGSGKTVAFGLPIIDLITRNKENTNKKKRNPKVIILSPTRELALQITKELIFFSKNKKLNILTVYGGSSINNQIKILDKGVDIVVGTPGRVIDLIKKKKLNLSNVEHVVLDEADEMLNMGFIDDIEFILSFCSKDKRTYLFSATMPNRIKKLSQNYMKNQKIIEVASKEDFNVLIEQFFVISKKKQKNKDLINYIKYEEFFYGIIFCKTKLEVKNLKKMFKEHGFKRVDVLHGDIKQSKREIILDKFRKSKIDILIATDVAARGLDIKNLTHIVNYSLPDTIESYKHRIGRTGRAGNKGKALTFITSYELKNISIIENNLDVRINKLKL